MDSETLTACHECDLILKIPTDAAEKAVITCPRCEAVIRKKKKNSLDRALALALAGLILFIVVNVFPFIGIRIDERIQRTVLITGVIQLYYHGQIALAVLVFVNIILAPFFLVTGLLYVLIPIQFGKVPKNLPVVFRFVRNLQDWSMIDVFMLGIFVSVIKLAGMAEIIVGPALYALFALIFIKTFMISVLDPMEVWEKWEEREA